MRIIQLMVLVGVLFLAGCWDSSISPLIKNVSGQNVTLYLVFDEKEESFAIKNNDSLLLPNVVSEESLKEFKISSGTEESIISKKEIIQYLKSKKEVFIIQEGLMVKAEFKD